MKAYGRPGTERGFHFLTADLDNIKAVTASVGFKYRWNSEQKAWDHSSAAILVSPDGKIVRYLHGIIFDPNTLKMGLNDAGQGKVGTIVEQLVWYCFHYDPKQSKYVLYAFRVMQLGGGLMVLALALLLLPQWRRWRRREV